MYHRMTRQDSNDMSHNYHLSAATAYFLFTVPRQRCFSIGINIKQRVSGAHWRTKQSKRGKTGDPMSS